MRSWYLNSSLGGRWNTTAEGETFLWKSTTVVSPRNGRVMELLMWSNLLLETVWAEVCWLVQIGHRDVVNGCDAGSIQTCTC